MSHYRVAVIQTLTSPGVEELMLPYDENLDVEPYVCKPRDEALAEARDNFEKACESIAAGTDRPWDYWAKHARENGKPTDEELLDWFADWTDWERDAEGNFLSTYNPDSHYDYYCEIDALTLEEWANDTSDETEDELRRQWKVLSTRGDKFYTKLYFQERYGDEDTFVRSCMLPACWAVVTPDGAWHEPGRVGWFGSDDATAESQRDWALHFRERFIEPYDPDETTVAMLDCHI